MLLVSVGEFPRDLLEEISRRTRIPVAPGTLDPAAALNAARGQYESTRLLAVLKERYREGIVVGAAACDLYVPVLTFVFGEAEMPGRAALFSIHRLREEFYGLPPDRSLLIDRAVRELWHEVGHLHGLAHCPDWTCVMSASHAVERVDAKSERYCAACERKLRLNGVAAVG
jgi:archaemetzincin